MMSYNESLAEPVEAGGGKGMGDILDFLKKGDKELQLIPNEDVVLLLGNTGAGKSTVALYVAGDMKHLLSQEVEEGTGDFVIVDQDNRISRNSTVLSQTVVPQLLRDPKSGTIYYDCPGFSDTRSAAHEIGATYFIKKILDNSRSVKLVFVVSHHSVRKGVDRKDFMLLIKHAVDFIKKMDKYKSSIALVVTKVENIYITVGSTPTLVPDDKVINSIAKYIDKVKEDIKKNPYLLNSGHSEAIDFLEALTFKVNDSYQRIGVFRRPDKIGTLNEIEALKNGKQTLIKIINENIQFKKVDVQDFGYTISPLSKIHINDVIEEINKIIINELVALGNLLNSIYVAEEGEIIDLDGLEEKYKDIREIFLKIQNLASEDKVTSQEYLSLLRKTINDLKMTDFSDYNLSRIAKQEQYVNFLRYVSNQSNKNDKASQLANGLSNLLKYLYESEKWYSFLNRLYSTLSQYDIQKNLIIYNNDVITYQLSKYEEIQFNALKLSSQLGRIITEAFKEYREIDGIVLNRSKQNLMIKLLDLTLKDKISFDCSNSSELFVKGRYLKLSEVSKKLNDLKCSKGIKSVYLFATDKIFLDTSFDLTGREVQLAIVAPIWDVIGYPHIKLDGKPGPEHSPNKAASGYMTGNRGEDGLPGHPGGPAGSFFGMGTQFVNIEQLFISANGGSGGMGQIGGDGSGGADAKPDGKKSMYTLVPLLIYNKAKYEIVGQHGGDGGNGGVGGYGGHKGKVAILDVGHKGRIVKARVSAEDGKQGFNGGGGSGGLGGRYGDYTWTNYVIFVVQTSLEHGYVRARTGRSGYSGMIHYGIKDTWDIKEHLNPYNVIKKYLQYSRENLKDNIKGTSMETFLAEIEDANIDTRLKRNAKYNEIGEKYRETTVDIGSTAFLDDFNSNKGHFVTSGSSSGSKHSLIGGILNLAMGGVTWLRHKGAPTEQLEGQSGNGGTAWHLPLSYSNKILSEDSKENHLHWNPGQPLRLADSYGNILLWDLLLKKLTGRVSSLPSSKIDDYEQRVSFASDLAYRHYKP